MATDYKPTGILHDACLKWKDAITAIKNVQSSKEIAKLQSSLHTKFCKSVIKEVKENYYIIDNDLV